jgi:hypothetical protein
VPFTADATGQELHRQLRGGASVVDSPIRNLYVELLLDSVRQNAFPKPRADGPY